MSPSGTMKEDAASKKSTGKTAMFIIVGLLVALLAIGLFVPRLAAGGFGEFKFLGGKLPETVIDYRTGPAASDYYEERVYTLPEDSSVVKQAAEVELKGLGYLREPPPINIEFGVEPPAYWTKSSSTVDIGKSTESPHSTIVETMHHVPGSLLHRIQMWVTRVMH